MERIFLSPPHMGTKERQFVDEAFESNWVAPLGPMVDAFETEIASYVGVPYAAAVSSGTAAIHLGLRLLGVKPGDIVLCSSLTFVASANPIVYLGAKPVFVDSDPISGNMSPQALRAALDSLRARGLRPRAAVLVDLYGQACRYKEIIPLLRDEGIPFLEDAAEALGATYDGKMCGSFGDIGILSFNGNKILNTSGGGMVLCRDKSQYEKIIFWATQAKDPAPHYEHSEWGFNYRMSNLLAAVGRGQLSWLDERIRIKRQIFDRYKESLGGYKGLSFFGDPPTGENTRWLSVLFVAPESGVQRDSCLEALGRQNIEARPVWKPMHAQKLFADCEYFPHAPSQSVSDQLFERGLCLPCGSSLSPEQQNRVISTLRDLFERSRAEVGARP